MTIDFEFHSPCMSDQTHYDIEFKNKMALVSSILNTPGHNIRIIGLINISYIEFRQKIS